MKRTVFDEKWKERKTKTAFYHHRTRARAYEKTVEYELQQLIDHVATFDRCLYCSTELTPKNLQLDHRIPVSRHGLFTLENTAPCCDRCNMAKGNLTEAEYGSLRELLENWDPIARKSVIARLIAGAKLCRN